MASFHEFEPEKAFKSIDQDQDGLIDTTDIVSFMKKFYAKISKQEAALIIREYDSDYDGALSIEDFK